MFSLRGVMLDPGRVTERKEYYRGLLPWLAEWGYNLIHLHLIDDQRCALRFPSHPELATPGAFTPEEMRGFVALARSHGIEVMPEVECLGHTALITSHPKYRHLAEKPPPGAHFNAICPSHPDTRRLLGDLLRDVAEIFPHPVIHVGLDEVQFGDCPRCRQGRGPSNAERGTRSSERGARSSRSPFPVPRSESGGLWPWRFAEHAAWVHETVRGLGRRPAMWADHVVERPEMMKSFRRDVLMFNWQYVPEYESAKAGLLLEAGFEAVACPALVCYGTRIAPNAMNLANLRNTAARSLPERRRGLVGLVNTVWCPWRYLPGAIDYGLALGAHLFTAEAEDPRFAERFAKRFYGLGDGRRVGAALAGLCECGLEQRLHDRTMAGACRSEPFSREDRRLLGPVAERTGAVLAGLKSERGRVRRNRARYDDLIISAEAILAVARFGAAGRRKSAVPGARALYLRAVRSWNRDRHPADAMRFGDGLHGAVQSLLHNLRGLR